MPPVGPKRFHRAARRRWAEASWEKGSVPKFHPRKRRPTHRASVDRRADCLAKPAALRRRLPCRRRWRRRGARAASEKSRRTGTIRAQAAIESAKSVSSTPLTKIIFLRSRTFTTTSFIDSTVGFREALRMNEPGDFFETFADTRSGPENLVRLIGVDSVLPHGGNGLEIAPMFGGFAALRSHAGLDGPLRRFGHDVL